MTLAPAVEKMVHAADPDQAVSAVRPLTDIVSAQAAPRRVQAVILGAFAVLAFVMAVVGLYGVLSYAVSSRTQEIGVRVALGASRRDILALFLRQGLLTGAVGIAAALPLAYATARAMRALLFGVDPGDPVIYLGSAATALLMTLLASARPSFRAARIDPAFDDQGRLSGVAPHSPKPSVVNVVIKRSTSAADGFASGGRAGPNRDSKPGDERLCRAHVAGRGNRVDHRDRQRLKAPRFHQVAAVEGLAERDVQLRREVVSGTDAAARAGCEPPAALRRCPTADRSDRRRRRAHGDTPPGRDW